MKNLLQKIILLVFGLGIAAYNLNAQSSPKGIARIDKADIQKHLKYLGSDLFEGRGTGETGGNLAAKYLAGEFDKLGLIPKGSEGTYYQYVPMHGSTPEESSNLILHTNEAKINLDLKEDYLLYKSGDQTYTPNPLPLVFVGYGINAPEFDYNDYQSIDVEGKIVVMLEGEPPSNSKDYFGGKNPTVHSYPESKMRTAIARGARGSIIIPNPDASNFHWESLKRDFSFEDVTLAYSVTANLSLLVKPSKAELLFRECQYSLSDILNMHRNNRMQSFGLNSKLSFTGNFARRDFVAPNIIGMVEGSNSEFNDTYLLISAHYDHLGIGPPMKGDSVYNGVMDNAIGTAALLELAEAFTEMENKPKRSIVFLLVTGEEKGLLGSTYYTDHPAVPLHKTIANLNIDGIAAYDRFKSVIGVGSDYSTLGNFLIKTARQNDLQIGEIPPKFKNYETFNRSDQIAFAKAGIPSILILDAPPYENISREEGLQKMINYNKNIYHTPFDDLSQEINYQAVMQHVKFLFDFSLNIADSEKKPEWKKGVPYINARLRTEAEKR
jgi:hypothetical protein